MTGGAVLACRVDTRRDRARLKGLNGIDDVEVGDVDEGDGSVTLCVHFLGPVPTDVGTANIRIRGGRKVRGIRVVRAAPNPAVREDDDDCLEIVLERAGDRSTYTICLVEPDEFGRPGETPLRGLDPRYHCRDFTFTANCANDLDCLADVSCPPVPLRAEAYDYLAKDYATFRRLLLDRIALHVPAWRERHVPDLGVTLVELLAYVGDQLSYYQDAVATEAYLETARQRISVRRHGRLVDYQLHEGCNARAFVVVEVQSDFKRPPAEMAFLTSFPGAPPPGRPLAWDDLAPPDEAGYRCFEPLVDDSSEELEFLALRHEIRIHTWGDRECCLPAGATSVTLVDRAGDRPLGLDIGDYVVFEEVVGPHTGQPGDADPSHRHVVRLTNKESGMDEVVGVPVLEVTWALADALPFPLCVSAIGPAPECRLLEGVSVARGNVVLVDDGCRIGPEPLPVVPAVATRPVCEGECRPAEEVPRSGRYRQALHRRDVTHAEPLPAAGACRCPLPAAAMGQRDPHAALPAVSLIAREAKWSARPDLLASGPDDRHFVVEVDDGRRAWLRFGDGMVGERPAPGTAFAATYRVGNGPGGNVGAEMLVHLALRGTSSDAAVRPRNPLPALGGTAPEDLTDARLAIPVAFRALRERAVTGDDYAELAMRAGAGRLQQAQGDLVWTGSWYEAEVALDPRGGGVAGAHSGYGCGGGCGGGDARARWGCGADDGVEVAVGTTLERARRMGHDLRVRLAEVVPVDLQLTVCVLPHFIQAHVKAALYRAFGSGVLADGTLAFFHPDRWTFGEGVHVSQLVAAAQSVAGVESVEVTHLAREGEPERGERTAGVLAIRPHEVAALDNDPVRARSGLVDIVASGGR